MAGEAQEPRGCESGDEPPAPNYAVLAIEYPYEPIGEIHSEHDTTAEFTLGKTADSDMGVGYSWNHGPWNVNGAVHMGETRETISDTGAQGPYWSHKILSKFRYEHEHTDWCGGVDRIRTTNWYSDIIPGSDVSYLDGPSNFEHVYKESCAEGTPGEGCTYRGFPGGHYEKVKGRGVRYTAGVSAFGVTLSAQSGFSTTFKWTMYFGRVYCHHMVFSHRGHPDSVGNGYSYVAYPGQPRCGLS